jgi:hypothetical protein
MELAEDRAVTPLHEASVARRLRWSQTFKITKRSNFLKVF